MRGFRGAPCARLPSDGPGATVVPERRRGRGERAAAQDGYELRREHQPQNAFLPQFALYEAMMNAAPYSALRTHLAAEHVGTLTAALALVPWEPWRWPNRLHTFLRRPRPVNVGEEVAHGRQVELGGRATTSLPLTAFNS